MFSLKVVPCHSPLIYNVQPNRPPLSTADLSTRGIILSSNSTTGFEAWENGKLAMWVRLSVSKGPPSLPFKRGFCFPSLPFLRSCVWLPVLCCVVLLFLFLSVLSLRLWISKAFPVFLFLEWSLFFSFLTS